MYMRSSYSKQVGGNAIEPQSSTSTTLLSFVLSIPSVALAPVALQFVLQKILASTRQFSLDGDEVIDPTKFIDEIEEDGVAISLRKEVASLALPVGSTTMIFDAQLFANWVQVHDCTNCRLWDLVDERVGR
mmetsp:Transcript_11864/g.32655  ORF Transcript_11864/g.32655 Transcript_11864/m.32655 type:complete len:131 (+) Transcript_11864:402-794(+)